MTVQEKSLFIASMGVSIYTLWDWLDDHKLNSLEEAVVHYYDHHYGK